MSQPSKKQTAPAYRASWAGKPGNIRHGRVPYVRGRGLGNHSYHRRRHQDTTGQSGTGH